ncbi:ATP-binding cassette domain-containing protein [Microcystis aeruginosa]|uniref:ATP-binding cassette domain-containing protein n=1 Tax=Microcystis aeruginosa FD4 TaxID=2686288 RepID=A0A857D6X8_MICAE|nr:ATP-binding cassette domain-containing protein [Microcystis aeruginosa]QGZ91668.1 ATP-binding cassette domain-containing protein [Microcystis aeruginosa FD4]
MFVETIGAIGTGVGVIEISEKLFPTFKRIFNLLKNGELKIAIFGAGGTGKSTLGKLLSGEFELSGLLQTYQESISIEQYKLESNKIGSVIVAPGQKRREDTWDDLLRTLVGGKIKLIIHVVSWGYQSFGEFSYTQHRLYQSGMTLEEFLREYAAVCRNRELDVLRRIEPHFSIADQRKTIVITLVTKQDLWWNNRLEVNKHYVEGTYEQLIQNIRNKRGANNFIHEYRSTSLVMENFLSGDNELLIPTTQGYDQRLKVANFRYFLNAIKSLFQISLNVQEK